jgi:transposase
MSPLFTPKKTVKHREADTVKKTRFFEAYDSQTRGIQSLALEHNITKQTTYNWLKQRQIQGSPAYRRNRKLTERLGRHPKLTNHQIQRLLSVTTTSWTGRLAESRD